MCPSQSNWQIINTVVCDALNSVSIAEMAKPFKVQTKFKYKQDKINLSMNNRMG
jgi:hypothetical protein